MPEKLIRRTYTVNQTDYEQAQKVFEKLGLSVSSGIALYLQAVVREQGVPFDLRLKPKAD